MKEALKNIKDKLEEDLKLPERIVLPKEALMFWKTHIFKINTNFSAKMMAPNRIFALPSAPVVVNFYTEWFKKLILKNAK